MRVFEGLANSDSLPPLDLPTAYLQRPLIMRFPKRLIYSKLMDHKLDTRSSRLTANIKSAGCAAKIGSAELREIVRGITIVPNEKLLTGIENFEDAAVYKLTNDVAIVQTVDFFPPVVDDPYLFGRIAAVNALSDVYAMGGQPIMALNILSFPTCDYELSVAQEILRGGSEAIAESGAVLAGGHSIQGAEPLYGLSVTGTVNPQRILTNSGAQKNDVIVLCKRIGTGVGLLGLKGEVLSETAEKALLENLTTLNKSCAEIALNYSINAATDVTGFGLIGHLHEMAAGSGLSARVQSSRVPLLPEVYELAEQGFVPAAAYGNRKSFERFASYIKDATEAIVDLMFDPQTSGGLMFAVPTSDCDNLVKGLHENGVGAWIIGEFVEGIPGVVEVHS
jgi:selenide,water dikinase